MVFFMFTNIDMGCGLYTGHIIIYFINFFLHPACSSLNVIVSHNFIASGIIRRCGFIGVHMALLVEVCHCGGGQGLS